MLLTFSTYLELEERKMVGSESRLKPRDEQKSGIEDLLEVSQAGADVQYQMRVLYGLT